MTLINSLQKRALLATVVLMLIGSSLYAKGKLTLSGRIVNSDGNKVKKAMVTLLSGGEVVDEEKTGRNGKFKFKKLEEGDYVLQASHDDLGSAEKIVTLTGKEDIGDITLSTEKPSAPIADAKDVSIFTFVCFNCGSIIERADKKASLKFSGTKLSVFFLAKDLSCFVIPPIL